MNALLSDITGFALVAASAVGTTAALYGRVRRGAGRVAVALAWTALGLLGITLVASQFAPTVIGPAGTVAVGVALACAGTLGALRSRELTVARRRDAALGQPPIPPRPSTGTVVAATGLASIAASAVLIAPWMLVAAASTGIPPSRILPGFLADLAASAPIFWAVLAALAVLRIRRIAADSDLLRNGVDTGVAEAEADGYRSGFADGREDGYRHAAFGTSWE